MEMEKAEIYRLLDLSSNASREELEHRCEALLDWLESDGVPEELRPWASRQATLIQAAYEGLSLPEGEGVVEARPESPPPPKTRVAEAGKGHRPFIHHLVARPLISVSMGVVLGLVVVGALWWSGVIFDGGEEVPSLPGDVDSAHILEASQARIDELEKVLAANPGDATALFELGETHMVGADWEGAIRWFERLLQVDPTNVHAQIDVGTANMELGRKNEAEAAFYQALALDPENIQANYNLAFLFAFRGDEPNLGEAVAHWQEVVRLAPDSDLAEVSRVHIDEFQPSVLDPDARE